MHVQSLDTGTAATMHLSLDDERTKLVGAPAMIAAGQDDKCAVYRCADAFLILLLDLDSCITLVLSRRSSTITMASFSLKL